MKERRKDRRKGIRKGERKGEERGGKGRKTDRKKWRINTCKGGKGSDLISPRNILDMCRLLSPSFPTVARPIRALLHDV